jgi:DEAD/DEAH box helicase domain-containing protein
VKWNDVGQKHEMVRFHHASAWVDHNTSLVGDDDDERERKTYQIGAFFDIPRQQVNSAYLLPNLPFGFEYLDRVTMREVNFGSSETLGQKITVCETEFTENGFQVCHDCGVVVNGPQAANSATPPQHTRNCLSRGNNRQPEWNNLYLYREVTSEALRILLPVSTTLVDEKITTFEACIDLGLRRWFRGDPEHLQIRTHTEPALDGSRRRFLVIYDTIPGGTSYLRDLVRPENFFRVLRLALDTLTSCRCRLDPAKQACYRCLYSYRSQRNLELISRALGVEMLGSILAQQSNLETIPTLSDAHIDSLIESELEQRFIDALQKYANENKQDCSWHPILRNGKRAWEFKAGNTKWWIEPQVVLDETYQVRTPSKADFVFFSTQPNQRPIAVFTDGFAYHVRPNETFGNLGDDLLKRCALLDSGQFVVWSITWDDVKEFEDQAPFALHLFANQQRQFDRVAHESRSPLSARLMRENAIAQLIEYLKFPDRPVWMQTVHRFLLVSAMPLRPSVDESVVQALTDTLRTQPAMPVLTIPDNAPAGTHAYEIISARHNTLLMHTPQASLRDAVALSLTVRLDDMKLVRGSQDFRQDWRQFLLLCNLYQFLPGFVPITSELIERYGMPQRTSEPAPARTSSLSTEWAQAFEYANPVCDDLLNACLSAGIGAPVVGHELAQDNRIVASAELAWPAQRVAVLLGESDGDRSAFTATQWKVWLLTERDAILDALGHSV